MVSKGGSKRDGVSASTSESREREARGTGVFASANGGGKRKGKQKGRGFLLHQAEAYDQIGPWGRDVEVI